MKKRKPKKKDQGNTERAFQILKKAMQNSDIESTLWAGATWGVLIDGYIKSKCSYEEFCQEIDKVKLHYKHWWDNDH